MEQRVAGTQQDVAETGGWTKRGLNRKWHRQEVGQSMAGTGEAKTGGGTESGWKRKWQRQEVGRRVAGTGNGRDRMRLRQEVAEAGSGRDRQYDRE